MACTHARIGIPRRTLAHAAMVAGTLTFLGFAVVLFRDRLAEELHPIKPGAVAVSFRNDYTATDVNGNRRFETEVLLQSEERFQLRVWWEALAESAANDLLAIAENPSRGLPPGSTVLGGGGPVGVAVPRSVPSSGSGTASPPPPQPDKPCITVQECDSSGGLHPIGAISPSRRYIGHRYVLPATLMVSTEGVRIGGGETWIGCVLPLPRCKGARWQLVSVVGAGPAESSCLSLDVPKSYSSMLFAATDPVTGHREVCAFCLWLALESDTGNALDSSGRGQHD
jgi:hypothetical protein